MGGNALKNTNTVRVTTETLNRVVERLTEYFEVNYPMLQVEPVKSYGSKETHGDLDLLYSVKPEFSTVTTVTTVHFTHFVDDYIKMLTEKNLEYKGNVLSFPYDLGDGTYLQVDLIRTRPEIFEMSQCYFNYNDLSNLLGRMTKKLGFKLGHDGLSYIERDGDYIITDEVFSVNYYDALEFLELDVEKYKSGFNTLEELFEYVASSPYFNPDIYLLHNRNHVSRVRDKKRKTYNLFLKWCEENNDNLNHYPYNNTNDYDGYGSANNIQETFIKKLFEKYPLLAYKNLQNRAKYILDKNFKNYFNGVVVKDFIEKETGKVIEGKELGYYMKRIKFSNVNTTDKKIETIKNKKYTFSDELAEYLDIYGKNQGNI